MFISVMGCSSTRFLAKDQVMVGKVKLKNVDARFEEQAYEYVQRDLRKPSWLNLRLYNLVNTKQGHYRTENIKKIGQAPALLDSPLVEISRTQIEKFLQSKGFLKAKVQSNIAVNKQKARITFTTNAGPEYIVNAIAYSIPDTAVQSLYLKNKVSMSHLAEGKRFDADSLSTEREQVYQMMRKNGYYDYLRQYLRFEVDTSGTQNKVDLKLIIANPKSKSAHETYTIGNSYLAIRTSTGALAGTKVDSTVLDNQFYLKDYSGRFKLKPITRYIFSKKGGKYNLEAENLSYDRLYDLNVFRNIKISYQKQSDTSHVLDAIYDFTPLKKMSNRIEGEYTLNAAKNGFNIGNTYTNRNLFGGAEQLDLKLRYGVLFESKSVSQLSDRAFNREVELGANLIFPRIVIPFKNTVSSKNGLPHTTFSTSFQYFSQKSAFENRTFINSITYDWTETKFKKHTFTPLSLEYRNGKLDEDFKTYLNANGFALYVKTNDRQFVNFGSQYTFTLNNILLSSSSNFFYFKASADLSGNTLGLLNKVLNLKSDVNGDRTVFGLPYLQYAKAEFDLRWYKHFGGDKQLVFRLNPGIGIPYGNSKALPIEKNFYAGGTNGIRAWQARTLGPGAYNRADIDPQIRQNLRNLDQLGELKFEGNLEYRFKILNNLFGAKVKGATFADFGNIWRIRSVAENPGGEFNSSKFFKQFAIGAGAGLRFDMDYFIFRLDAAVKIRDPQFTDSNQWVIKNLFNKEFKQTYASTHYPDVYRFVQYNFGIGMPF
ncbi:MAG: BamA/TamA family outer membrane protein [Sphingobacteriaceae bacterium]